MRREVLAFWQTVIVAATIVFGVCFVMTEIRACTVAASCTSCRSAEVKEKINVP